MVEQARYQHLRQGYNSEAARYDTVRYVSAEGEYFNELESKLIEEWLTPLESKKILDIPTGTARLALPLARQGAHVTAGDISPEMLKHGESKAVAEGLKGIEFREMNGLALPFGDDYFDAVISFKFFHLIPNADKPAFLQEMRRVLRPGGRLIAEFNSPYYGGLLAFFRYYFTKKRPGQMRNKCLFPDQVAGLFSGFRIQRIRGVKLPLTGRLAKLFGRRPVDSVNRLVGRIPAVRYLCYVVCIEAEKV